MSIQRVALIFDDQARPETTGVYCLRALRRLVAVEHFRPADLDRIPREGFDLYLRIDDGFDYRLPAGLRPCAWWVIDTHLNFERHVARAADSLGCRRRLSGKELSDFPGPAGGPSAARRSGRVPRPWP
jgi:hypothetical protein